VRKILQSALKAWLKGITVGSRGEGSGWKRLWQDTQ
jgi:hypothetical protein